MTRWTAAAALVAAAVTVLLLTVWTCTAVTVGPAEPAPSTTTR